MYSEKMRFEGSYSQGLGQLFPEKGASLGKVLHLSHQGVLRGIPHQVMADSLCSTLQPCLGYFQGKG